MVTKGGQKLTSKQIDLISLIKQYPGISRREISEKLNINESAVQRRLDVFRKKDVLRRVGPDKGGHWETQEL